MNSLNAFLSPAMLNADLNWLGGSDSSSLPIGPSRNDLTRAAASLADPHWRAAPTRTPVPPGVVHTPNVVADFPWSSRSLKSLATAPVVDPMYGFIPPVA